MVLISLTGTKSHPSTIIVASMDHSCYVTISRKPNFFPEYKSRIAYGKIEHVTDNTKIIHPSVRECLRFFNFESGIDIYHAGDLPARVELDQAPLLRWD